MDGSPSLPFDRVADRYDETRGGEARGRRLAAGVAQRLRPGRTLEVGVGTGLVAAGLREQGYDVLGVDLSPAMLARARARLGPRVALGDALALPVAAASVDNVVFSCALHVIVDVAGALREAARVLRPGGRVVAVHAPGGAGTETATGGGPSVDVERLIGRLPNERADTPDAVDAAARAAGLTATASGTIAAGTRDESPNLLAEGITQRLWSNLWAVDDATWREVVVPVIDGLRALPEPDRPRPRPVTFRVSAYAR